MKYVPMNNEGYPLTDEGFDTYEEAEAIADAAGGYVMTTFA